MRINTINLTLLSIAAGLSWYAISANAAFAWVLLIVFCFWFVGEIIAHRDSRVPDKVGKRYSFTRLGLYSAGVCVAWITFVQAIGV